LISSLELPEFKLPEHLAMADSPFLAEAVAIEIEERPKPDPISIAEVCGRHLHRQAAKAGALPSVRFA